MKFAKRFLVILVLCLAVFGAMSLFKRAPELNLSTEDVDYLRAMGKTASTDASKEGLSGVLMNVEGAPPIDALGFSAGSSTPPASFGLPSGSADETPAPAWSAPAAPVANPYSAPVEAPPFIPAPQNEPPQIPEPVAEPTVYAVPVATLVHPNRLEIPEPSGRQALNPAGLKGGDSGNQNAYSTCTPFEQSPVPAISPPPDEMARSSPLTVPPEPTAFWNGPATEIINFPVQITSSEQTAPQGDFGVSWANESANGLRNDETLAAQTPVRRLPVVPGPFLAELPVATEDVYRPTSVRQGVPIDTIPSATVESGTVSFGAIPVVANDSTPVVSFVHSEAQSVLPPSISTASAATIPPRSESSNTEKSPFIEPPLAAQPSTPPAAPSVTSPVAVPIATSSPAVNQATDLSAQLRPTVTRFVKAQGVLADSGDPIKMRAAFIQLSKMYEMPELNDAERQTMRPILDRLALAIIYSRHLHVLEPAYTVWAGDTVESVAAAHSISPELLCKINGLSTTQALTPGMSLKTVLGRFDAKISASRSEITLILGGLYAGCFPVNFGEQLVVIRGEYYVNAKTSGPSRALTLNNGITLIGAEQTASPTTAIRLSPHDAHEVFDILTEQSIVVFED